MKLIIVIIIRANPAKFNNTVKVSNCHKHQIFENIL